MFLRRLSANSWAIFKYRVAHLTQRFFIVGQHIVEGQLQFTDKST